MKARKVHLAGWNQEVAVNQVHDAVGEIGREVGSVVSAAILAQTASHVHAREALGERQLHIRIGLVVTQVKIITRPVLFDEIVFEEEGLLLVTR